MNLDIRNAIERERPFWNQRWDIAVCPECHRTCASGRVWRMDESAPWICHGPTVGDPGYEPNHGHRVECVRVEVAPVAVREQGE